MNGGTGAGLTSELGLFRRDAPETDGLSAHSMMRGITSA